jgi:hypothetical protein
LATAIQNYLGSTTSGAGIHIDILPSGSQNSGTRQFVVTLTDPVALPVGAPTGAGAPQAAAAVPPMIPETRPLAAPTILKTPMPYADSSAAYWAAQPPEVQAMRSIPDVGARDAKAQELAKQGFTIDYPIMVWQWDPLSTMRERIKDGYTWIPAVGQPSIEVTAGASFPGKKSYDPRNPPRGSVAVSTVFADGYDS